MIKKNITIILISAAIAAAIIFVDKIVLADHPGGPPSESGESINNNAVDDIADAGIIGKELNSEMIEQDFFIVVPAGTNKDSDDKSSIGTEAAIEESGTVSDIEIREDVRIDPDSEQNEIAASGDYAETAPDENIGDNQQPFLDEENIDFSDSGNFRIEIDLSRQRVTVFYKDDMLREMVCSGGAPESPTPKGEFVTSQKIPKAFIERFGVGAYYWIRFFEEYLIHSVPFDENWEMITEEFEKLGSPASHGCIRLKLEEAKWLYETLPLGVKVLIY